MVLTNWIDFQLLEGLEAVEAYDRNDHARMSPSDAVPTASDGPRTVCPTCENVVIDADQVVCSRCADMPRLAREIKAFKQPGGATGE